MTTATAAERVANTLTPPMVAALHAADAGDLCRNELTARGTSWMRGEKWALVTRTTRALVTRGLIESGPRVPGSRYSAWQVTGLGEQVLACLPERRAET